MTVTETGKPGPEAVDSLRLRPPHHVRRFRTGAQGIGAPAEHHSEADHPGPEESNMTVSLAQEDWQISTAGIDQCPEPPEPKSLRTWATGRQPRYSTCPLNVGRRGMPRGECIRWKRSEYHWQVQRDCRSGLSQSHRIARSSVRGELVEGSPPMVRQAHHERNLCPARTLR